MISGTWTVRVALLGALAVSAAGCGDGDVHFIPGNGVDPTPGSFVGATSAGGVVAIQVGSIDAITMVCQGATVGGSCNPKVEVSGGNANGTCGGLTFDLTFTDDDSVEGDVSGGTSCDGSVTASRASVRTPTPTPTASGAPKTATPTPSGEVSVTPTATATPSGATCGADAHIMVALSLDAQYGGAVTFVEYPTGSVTLPGSFSDQSVADRVTFAPSGGFTTVNDLDTGSDGIDDTIFTSFAGTDPNAAGLFVTIDFDCSQCAPAPGASDFTCGVDSASDELGNPLSGVGCALVVTGP